MRRMCRGIEIEHFIGEPTCPLGDACQNRDEHSSEGSECVGPNQYIVGTGFGAGFCEVCRSRLIECAEPITVDEEVGTETCAAGHEVTDFDVHFYWHSRTLLDAGIGSDGPV